MNTTIINVLIDQFAIYILPPLIAFVWTTGVVYAKKAAEKLPSNVRKVLWDYTNTVVKSIMQKADEDWTDEQKKEYAVDEIRFLLERVSKKVSSMIPDELIGHVIEQVIFEIKKTTPPTPPAQPAIRRASL
jgi:Na+/pantothenate symporter